MIALQCFSSPCSLLQAKTVLKDNKQNYAVMQWCYGNWYCIKNMALHCAMFRQSQVATFRQLRVATQQQEEARVDFPSFLSSSSHFFFWEFFLPDNRHLNLRITMTMTITITITLLSLQQQLLLLLRVLLVSWVARQPSSSPSPFVTLSIVPHFGLCRTLQYSIVPHSTIYRHPPRLHLSPRLAPIPHIYHFFHTKVQQKSQQNWFCDKRLHLLSPRLAPVLNPAPRIGFSVTNVTKYNTLAVWDMTTNVEPVEKREIITLSMYVVLVSVWDMETGNRRRLKLLDVDCRVWHNWIWM